MRFSAQNQFLDILDLVADGSGLMARESYECLGLSEPISDQKGSGSAEQR